MNSTLIPAATKLQRKNCRNKFLFYFPDGFTDPKYCDWERNYKWDAHIAFQDQLNREEFSKLLSTKKYSEIALRAVRIETKTNLLFSFEKMALRDAVKIPSGAKSFASGLFMYLYGEEPVQNRFEKFAEVLNSLPRKQTRVFTWPLQTVFGFLGNPAEHIFVKPRVTQVAAEKYQYDISYQSKPDWNVYKKILSFADIIGKDNKDLKPKNYIDLQSFIWVMGSDEYPD